MKIVVVLITAILVILLVIDKIGAAPSVQNAFTAVGGFEGVISAKPPQTYTPAVGSKVDVLKTAGGGRVMLASGPVQSSQKGEKPLTYSEAFPASGIKTTYSTAKGKVIMTRGDVITVQIDEKDWPVEMGDAVKVSFSVDGEVIPVGTWRVNIVKEGGIVEAVPYEIQGKPSIGLDAHVVSRERPKVTKKTEKGEGYGARGKGWLGVAIRNLTPEERKILNLSQTEGILVESVAPDSPADKGGLKPGDIFLEVEDRGVPGVEDVVQTVSDGPPGKLLKIKFIRDGERRFARIKLAEKPDTDSGATYEQALKYYNGDGVLKDHKKAFGLFKEASEMGHDLAMVYIGWMFQHGEGVEKDPVMAVNWYKKAANQNNANAKNNLGIMYLNGEGVKQDYAMANKLFMETADSGNKYGYWNLGRIYNNGWGVEKNLNTAFSYYLKASEMGHVDAQDIVCEFYMNGTGVNKDYGKAYEWCTKAADSGFARSYNQLGIIYLNAYGVERDYKKAYMNFEKAANARNIWGYFNLGRLYDNGWGVLKDEQKALEYYRKFGDHVSAYRDGARKGHEEAKEWLRKRNIDW